MLRIAQYLHYLGCRFTYQITNEERVHWVGANEHVNLLTDYLHHHPQFITDWLKIGYSRIFGIYKLCKDLQSAKDGVMYNTVLGAIASKVDRDPQMLDIFGKFINYMARNASSFGGKRHVAYYIHESGATKEVMRQLPSKHYGKCVLKEYLRPFMTGWDGGELY